MSDLNLDDNGLEKQDQVFRPVVCTESAIASHDPIKGFVYFATDSQKIYYGDNDEYIPMGGNSGIYYSNKTFTESDMGYPTLSIEDFEAGELPKVDDLVINVGGNELYNGFYKVIDILSEEQVSVQYLPVGGGGSGGSGGGSSGSATIGYIFPATATDSVLAGQEYVIEYELKAEDSNGDPVINSGTARWYVNRRLVKEETVYPGINTFKIDPYLDASAGVNEVSVTVSIDTGGTIPAQARKPWSIKVVDLRLEWDYIYGESSLINSDTFALIWTPYGGVNCTTHIIFDNDLTPNVGYFTEDIKASYTGSSWSKTFNSLSYGSHQVEMYLTAEIDGVTYSTDSIFHQITFVKDGNTPILTVPFYQNFATQYDTIQIPFVAYDPNNNPTIVQFYVNGNQVSSDNYNRDLNYWNYTIDTYGTLELSLKCGDDTKTFILTVAELELDVSEASGAAFKLKASAFSGNDELRNWSHNGVSLTFSDNFDWENGGLQIETDEKGHKRKYICVKNNTTMTINYDLFKEFNRQGGKNFKIIFKAANCYDYDAQILSCHDGNIGLVLNAQSATFNGGGEALTTQYYEDSYIELETEIWPEQADTETRPGDRFIMFWVDGVPSNVKAYTVGSSFAQTSPKKIVIGSNNCDVYVYLVKTYERYLGTNDHINNFIMDAPNTEEMLSRYHRNDILDNRGKISYLKLIQNNPKCPIHLYEIDRMTRHKKDKVKGCHYEQYRSTPEKPDYIADNVTIKVQGTSSAAYGVAAFNIDSEFEDGMTDADGNIIKHYDENNNELTEYRGFWDMSGNSIPVNFTCTKVNVASCENANNALNAEWYNRYQPYYDAHRRKNPKARDCMEFIPGVMFIKDKNTVPAGGTPSVDPETGEAITAHASNAYANVFGDDEWYMGQSASNRPYWQYAICNMGNSKDNIHVFHDITNPMACCVEVLDNQNVEHWMTVKADMTAFEETDTKDAYYEFRYPEDPMKGESEDEFKVRLNTLKQKWLEFENWMASCDPRPYDADIHPFGYTGEELPNPVTYGEYTFKGFSPPGFENQDSPSGVSLKGFKTSKYAGTYTHDTKEYRIAKMLNECENHIVMDSVVYHYLFIERHTMVDNVAKNTFWSTEDGIHWDLTKNYDNDTADGNNNTGYLVYTYGIECMDKEKDSEKNVFNAIDSVWINFIDGLIDVRKDLFTKLDTKGAWNSSSYLRTFKDFQDNIPERCWIEDYFRKYIRPRRLNLDEDTYLKRLEGGKKTHQRAQYETYHEYYVASEYEAGVAQSQAEALDIRSNSSAGGFASDLVTPVTTYIDCYPRILIGGQPFKKRVKKGEVCNIPIGQLISSANDATTYYYPAPMIQTISGLENLYPTSVSLAYGKKLRSVTIGSDAEGYYNNNLNAAKISNNIMLESAFIQNSGIIGNITDSETGATQTNLGVLDLRKLKSLKELRINGSTYTGVLFAEAGLLEVAYINGVQRLEMSKLTHLKELEFDDNIYTTLKILVVKDCPFVNSYDLVNNATLQRYCLNGIDWTITNNTLDNGVLKQIDILEKLLAPGTLPLENMTTITALTGKITIDLACSADQYEIYKKYCKQFPNLEIIYNTSVGKVNLDSAVTIEFKTDEGENSDIHYKVLASGDADGLTIGQLTNIILDDAGNKLGPTNAILAQPTKVPTQALRYEFSGYWKDELGNRYYDNSIADENAGEGTNSLMNLIPEKDYIFTPIFNALPQIYTVYFIVDDEEVGRKEVQYNTVYNGDIKNYWYKDESKLPDDQRYKFLGWSTIPNKNRAEYVDILTLKVTGNVRLYGLFEQESVYTSATDMQYFAQMNVVDWGYSVNGQTIIPKRNWTGIAIKQEYKNILQGKITLPSKINGLTIEAIGPNGFSNEEKITHVYFLEDSECKLVGPSAFLNCPNLEVVNLPNSIIAIGDRGFESSLNLKTVPLNDNILYIGNSAFKGKIVNNTQMQVSITGLPANLVGLGPSAFNRAGPNVNISAFPLSLIDLGDSAFVYCANVAITDFGSDNDDGKVYLSSLPATCFQVAGTAKMSSITEIRFRKSIINIQNAFGLSYGSENNESLNKLIFGNEQAYGYYTAGKTGLKITNVENTWE